MSTLSCCTKIINIGQFAKDFYDEKMLITFKDNINSELLDYCLIFPKEMTANGVISIGKTLKLGDYKYAITAVGSVANKNFNDLGHITIIFDGNDSPKMDGTVHVKGDYPENVNIGDEFSIFNQCIL